VLLGHYEEALGCCQQAIDLHQELGDRHGEASAWDSLGYAHFHLGQRAQAVACYQQALERFRELGDRRNQADILTHLGDAHQAGGNQRLAREAWQQALLISDELRLPGGDELRARLWPGGPQLANVAQSR
jgi:tetratricopeptide (TPR) repeat protein